MQSFALTGARVFDGESWLQDATVVIQDERIDQVLSQAPSGDLPTINLQGGVLAPGFIDLQVNGGGGVLLNNAPTPDTLFKMVQGHRQKGTTSFLPTVISDTPDTLGSCINAVAHAMAECPALLGIHIEGPFFNVLKRGVHQEKFIRRCGPQDFQLLTSLPNGKTLVTLAPEEVPAEFIEQLVGAGVRVSAGHSNASFEETQVGISRGISGFTHLFNAMSPMTGRHPGVVGAALSADDCWVGIIADGLHVHPASIRLTVNAKPRGKTFLVSDAMATAGSDIQTFMLYGEEIREQQGGLVNSEGKLAGSAIGMVDAVRYCVETVGLDLGETLRMASLYPAQYLGIDEKLGRIEPGMRADLVHLSQQLQVKNTWVAGQSN